MTGIAKWFIWFAGLAMMCGFQTTAGFYLILAVMFDSFSTKKKD